MLEANVGFNVPVLTVRLLNEASLDCVPLTMIVYVSCVTPSGAVTTIVIGVEVPAFNVIGPEADPERTAVPFTVMVEPVCVAVGATVMLVVSLATASVYDIVLEANTGFKAPLLTVRALNEASLDCVPLTPIEYVSCVTPLGAVTTTLIVVEVAAFNVIGPEADPEVTRVPSTVIVELPWVAVGVTVMLVVSLATASV